MVDRARARGVHGLSVLVRRGMGWLFVVLALVVATLLPATARGPQDKPVPDIAAADLPREGRETLALIRRGGPFSYSRDGVEFGNREKRLPLQAKGYYREYTVKTPGSKDRGARRIVAGTRDEFYYTDDHYRTFRRIRE